MNNKDNITAWHIFKTIYCYVDFVVVNLLQLVCLPFVFLFTFAFDKDRRAMSYMIKVFYRLFYILNIVQIHQINLNGLKATKKGEKRVYVINHASIFDVILMSMLPGANKAVMKESYTKMPLIGWIAVLTGNIVLKQFMDDGQQIEFFMGLEEKLERGIPIVIFPEGTRSRDSKLGKFYDGSFKLAMDTHAEIVPVILDSWNIIRPGAYWIRDTRTTFKVLDTVKYEDYKRYSYKELTKVMRIKFLEELLNLRDSRRQKEKYYYRKKQKFEELDNQMREELKTLKEKYAHLLEPTYIHKDKEDK